MSKRSVWLTISFGVGIALFAVWLGGRALMAKFMAMHGMAPRTAASAWPSTEAGTLARGWVEAFNAGEPAMRSFLAEHHADPNLDRRMETYRENRERLRTLRLTAIGHSTATVIDTTLAAADGSKHEFTFETRAGKLTAVKRRARHGH